MNIFHTARVYFHFLHFVTIDLLTNDQLFLETKIPISHPDLKIEGASVVFFEKNL